MQLAKTPSQDDAHAHLKGEWQGWRQPNTTASAGMEAQGSKGDNNIPGKSIPQWYSYRLYVKLIQTITGDTVSLCIPIHRRRRAAASNGHIPQTQTTRQTLDPVYP
jgi:hypothetical protein